MDTKETLVNQPAEQQTVQAPTAPTNYRQERFEFALFVNNNLICKRNFKMNNFIEGSMASDDFKATIDEIV